MSDKKQTDGEAYYDTHLAPKLLQLAKDAHAHGMSFLSVVEWEHGMTGRTAWLQESADLTIGMADVAAQANGNIDVFLNWAQRYAARYGHNSFFLSQQGIPQKPDNKEKGEG